LLSRVYAFEPDANLATEGLSLAILHNQPVYDLIYIVLAMRFGARLLSADGELLQLAGQDRSQHGLSRHRPANATRRDLTPEFA